jgi:hypothetical protein
MKKVKLMLLSLSVLAVVSGALAFKVKQGQQFCVAAASSTSCPVNCPNLLAITDPVSPNDFICTAQSVDNGCTNVKCAFGPIHSTTE